MIRGNLSVRQLAEFVCRRGDLYPTNKGRQVSAEEGLKAQRIAQQSRQADNYHTEVPFELTFKLPNELPDEDTHYSLPAKDTHHSVEDTHKVEDESEPLFKDTRILRGRVDGIAYERDRTIIEEFKCCGELPDVPDGVDLGQAWIYAGLAACQSESKAEGNLPDAETEIRLIYVHADTYQEKVFDQVISRAQARASLDLMLLCYVARISAHLSRATKRRLWAENLAFPMASYRPSQQAIARRVYRAIESGENLLLEAPTGSGKTLAVMFPALKAQDTAAQLFFLTSRNAGAQAALAAAKQIDAGRETLTLVDITAKDKACLSPDTPCAADQCSYAKGYYDRIPAAVNALLSAGISDAKLIQETAQAHHVCPFELSLDAALWADVIVGDYNYVFDPMVRLQRFAGHEQLHLLIDEAHQLSPRVGDMLSTSLNRDQVLAAKNIAHNLVRKRVLSIDRTLMNIRRKVGEGEHEVADLAPLERAVSRFLEVIAEQQIELELYPELVDLYFAVHRWQRSENWYSAEAFTHIAQIEKRNICIHRVCLDVAPYLQSIYAEHGSVVRFSGTVSPLPLYQRLHGQAEAQAERAQSPFTNNQALVMVVRDIPTYYRAREQSLASLVQLIGDITEAHPGRYLIALPSYAYLRMLADALDGNLTNVLLQTPGLNTNETQALVTQFGSQEQGVLGIVMGGVLGESVDFTDASLSGVIMVGLGLPPPSLARNLTEQYFDNQEGAGWGRMVAYTQPALVKNIQAAGRLIRAEDDFGVICLIDPRFTSTEVQRFFPSHWQPQIRPAAQVKQTVEDFFATTLAHEERGAL